MKSVSNYDQGNGWDSPYIDGVDVLLEEIQCDEALESSIGEEGLKLFESYFEEPKKFYLQVREFLNDWLDERYA